MNIFVLSENPIEAAKMQCDKHVVKMPLETAQLLATAIYLNSPNLMAKYPLKEMRKRTDQAKALKLQYKADTKLYLPTHVNHPSTIWAAKSKCNFGWLVQHGIALCNEYSKRYDHKIHKAFDMISFCSLMSIGINFASNSLTEFAQALPDKYKDDDAVKAYRNYYLGDKAYMATWKSNKPDWWVI